MELMHVIKQSLETLQWISSNMVSQYHYLKAKLKIVLNCPTKQQLKFIFKHPQSSIFSSSSKKSLKSLTCMKLFFCILSCKSKGWKCSWQCWERTKSTIQLCCCARFLYRLARRYNDAIQQVSESYCRCRSNNANSAFYNWI